MSSDQLAFSLEIAGKALLYSALLPAIGVCAVRSLLLPRLGTSDRVAETGAALTRIGTSAAALVLIALGFRLFTHTIAVFGLPDAFAISQIRVVALESRWGGGWRVQVLASSALLAASMLIRIRPAMSSIVPGLAAVVLCYTVPLVGHAAGSPLRVVLHGSHLLAAGSWVGTLTVLLLIGLRRERGPGSDSASERAALRLKMLQGFSPVALSGSAVLVFTGAVSSVFYVGSLSSLWTSSYGLLLALKLAFVASTAGCGYLNWRHFAGGSDENRRSAVRASGPMPRTIAVEVLLAGAVVLVTAVLTEVAHP